MAKPLGTIFWALSVMTLVAGMGNYISEWLLLRHMYTSKLRGCTGTVNKYSKRAAIVQIGWKTHAVSLSTYPQYMALPSAKHHAQIFGLTAVSIIGTCLILLVIAKVRESTSNS